jgi:NTP pyrophosphatase (non-canonical NTP hydrolase)
MRISDLQLDSHDRAKRKGFYNPPPTVAERLCLIHSEVSEALEAHRDDEMGITFGLDGKPEGFPIELADIIIRVCDMAQYMNIDLEEAIRLKAEYNEKRPPGHGRVRL